MIISFKNYEYSTHLFFQNIVRMSLQERSHKYAFDMQGTKYIHLTLLTKLLHPMRFPVLLDVVSNTMPTIEDQISKLK